MCILHCFEDCGLEIPDVGKVKCAKSDVLVVLQTVILILSS